MLPDFLVESMSQWRNSNNGDEGSCDNVWKFNHYAYDIFLLFSNLWQLNIIFYTSQIFIPHYLFHNLFISSIHHIQKLFKFKPKFQEFIQYTINQFCPHLLKIFPTIGLFLNDPSIFGWLFKNSSLTLASFDLICWSWSSFKDTILFCSSGDILLNLSTVWLIVYKTYGRIGSFSNDIFPLAIPSKAISKKASSICALLLM